MRHGTTKGDIRGYWLERGAEAAIASCVMFFALVMLAIPTIAYSSWRLLLVLAFIVVCQMLFFARLVFCFMKYRKV